MQGVPPGLRESDSDKLTNGAKRAIDAYLMRYARVAFSVLGFLGLTSILSISASLLYVFFKLPDAAADKAFAAWDAKFSRYEERIEESLVRALELQASARLARKQLDELKTTLPQVGTQVATLRENSAKLEKTIAEVSSSDLARAAEIASALDAKTVAQAFRVANEALGMAEESRLLLEELSGRLEEAVKRIEEQVLLTHDLRRQLAGEARGEKDATGWPVRQD